MRRISEATAAQADAARLTDAKAQVLATGDLLRSVLAREARQVAQDARELIEEYLDHAEWGLAYDLITSCLTPASTAGLSVGQLAEVRRRFDKKSD